MGMSKVLVYKLPEIPMECPFCKHRRTRGFYECVLCDGVHEHLLCTLAEHGHCNRLEEIEIKEK